MLKGKSWIFLLMVLILALGMLVGCGQEAVAPEPEEEQPEEELPEYPTDTIIWTVARDPGDPQDITARGIAPYLSEVLGVNVVVDNKPGGGGVVGYGELWRQRPDGYYIGQDVLGQMANFDALGRLDDPLFEVEWFSIIYQSPAGIWVGADSEIKTVQDMIDMDRSLIYGDTTTAGTHVPWLVRFSDSLGIDFTYSTGWEGRGEIFAAVMRLEVDVVPNSFSGLVNQYLAGDMHCVMLMAPERHPLMPDVPTLGEIAEQYNMPELNKLLPMGMTTYMVGAPPGTPRYVTETLESAFKEVIENNDDFKAWAEEANQDIVFYGYDDTRRILGDVIKVLEEMNWKEVEAGLAN